MQKIYTRFVLDWDTGKVVESDFYWYDGPTATCKGASSQQTSLEQSQQNFYNTLTQNYQQMFAGQTNILKSLTTTLDPILQAGPSQNGFSPQEAASLKTQAIDTNAANFAGAEQQLNQTLASRDGDVALPSGAEAQLEEGLAASGAAQNTASLNQINLANEQQGQQNFQNATQALENTAGIYNPTGVSNSATSAGNAAGATANQIQQANAAASPWSLVGGILGGALSSAVGGGGALTKAGMP